MVCTEFRRSIVLLEEDPELLPDEADRCPLPLRPPEPLDRELALEEITKLSPLSSIYFICLRGETFSSSKSSATI